jgi:hypothetical protein
MEINPFVGKTLENITFTALDINYGKIIFTNTIFKVV